MHEWVHRETAGLRSTGKRRSMYMQMSSLNYRPSWNCTADIRQKWCHTPNILPQPLPEPSAPSHGNRSESLRCWPSTFSAQSPLHTTSLSFIIHLSARGRHKLNSQHLGFGAVCYLLTTGNKWEALRQMARLQSTDCYRRGFSHPSPLVTLKLITFHFTAVFSPFEMSLSQITAYRSKSEACTHVCERWPRSGIIPAASCSEL